MFLISFCAFADNNIKRPHRIVLCSHRSRMRIEPTQLRECFTSQGFLLIGKAAIIPFPFSRRTADNPAGSRLSPGFHRHFYCLNHRIPSGSLNFEYVNSGCVPCSCIWCYGFIGCCTRPLSNFPSCKSFRDLMQQEAGSLLPRTVSKLSSLNAIVSNARWPESSIVFQATEFHFGCLPPRQQRG